jgi:endonuclease III
MKLTHDLSQRQIDMVLARPHPARGTAMTKARVGPADLGIDLGKPTDAVVFRWLIACSLFGARISQEIAARAFGELDRALLLTPSKLANADWQVLVDQLGAGGYRRYDESTARELIEMGRLAVDKYGGKITRIRNGVASKKELTERVQEFKGVGPTAAKIFLREMAPAWKL